MAANSTTTTSSFVSLQDVPVTFIAAAGAVGLLSVFFYSTLFSSRKGGIVDVGGVSSILTAWPFFTKRYDFLKSNFQKTGEAIFKFKVLHHTVVAIRGEEGRKAFFDNKSLSFSEGYKILMGAAPRLSDISMDHENIENVSWFNKQLTHLLNRRRLDEVLPTLLEDLDRQMSSWGTESTIDPFRNVYDLVFLMTVRMATCDELARDPAAIKHIQSLYWTLEKSATPTALLLPWLPVRANKNKEAATKELFGIFYSYIEKRREAKVPRSDAIDVLLADGLDNTAIVGFILGVVFAGVINTGINSCWALIFLCTNKEWRAKVQAEVNALIANHTNTTSSEPLHKRLATIPVSVWEDEMPCMDTVIRETLRIVLNGTTLRRTVLEDLGIKDKTVGKGAFLAYQLSDVHLNPDIYRDPLVFDPDRFGPGREEDKKGHYAFLGWGAGRHPCTGMKVAKLEIKVILALFIAGYDFDVVDSSGNFPTEFPKVNYNDIHQARPIGKPVFLKYKRVVE
ncbi:cytochrome P450 [Pluteus cervinus]|uniref:Cytochrome P450 n=1 Tax=Pluteus cervinus TaxID=181527 RepID=A0ACD3AWI2_9AGAR|nr:cytochrome P450 [Pluteus cervinus]